VDPAGKFVFAVGDAGVMVYTLDASSGALTPISGDLLGPEPNPWGVALDPAGKYLYVANNSMKTDSAIFGLSIDRTTGALAQVPGSPYYRSETPYFVTVDPSGDLVYAANSLSDSITVYSLDKATGALSATGGPLSNGVGTRPEAIAVLK
jgi:DNA-binding beta-propeller fold protein YncE